MVVIPISHLFPSMTGSNTVPAARVREFSIQRIIVPVGVVAHPTALELKRQKP